MLKELYIHDFALIDELKINFVSGFNVFTGETGAGKSIILDALSFVLGKRADKTFIRKNKHKSIIEAVFFLSRTNETIDKFLEKEEIDFNDGTLFLRREIFEDGHSTSRINGKMVTITSLKTLTAALISVHEQNEFDEILIKENQLNILDSFAKIHSLDEYIQYQKIFDEYIKNKEELGKLEKDYLSSDTNRELDILNYQSKEIKIGKDILKDAQQIENEITKLENSEQISKSINYTYDLLYSGTDNLIDQIHSAIKKLEVFSGMDEKIDLWISSLYDCLYILEEVSRSIGANIDYFKYDEFQLEELTQKNNIINKLFSKYGKNEEEVLNFYEIITHRMDFILNLGVNREKLINKIKILEEELRNLAAKISIKRKSEGTHLKQLIENELYSLGMNNAQFDIEIRSDDRLNATGTDNIQFMVSFNKGEEMKPFNKVASGGEISRFVLSLKKVTAKNDSIDTMVFDEIDSGISGISANAVGKKLKEISREKQVICITHLPQIAANGDFHYLVSKYEDENNTITKIKLLNEEKRVNELSKMISGNQITQNSMNYARELLKESHKKT